MSSPTLSPMPLTAPNTDANTLCASTPKHTLRALFAACLVLLLHIAGLLWANGVGIHMPTTPTTPIIETELIKPAPVKIEAAAPAKKTPPHKAAVAHKPMPQTKENVFTTEKTKEDAVNKKMDTPENASQAQSDTASNGAKDGKQTSAGNGSDSQATSAENGNGSSTTSAAKTSQEGERGFNVPGSAKLIYDIDYYSQPRGTGEIDWRFDGTNYSLMIDLVLASFSSKGSIDAYGIAPDRYEEKIISKPLIATNFNRDNRQSISFSKVTSSLGLVDGAQDRFSFVMQLVGLMRADAKKYTPGKVISMHIADSDNVEIWDMQMRGDEVITVGDKVFHTKHFIRSRKKEGDTRSADLWLAEELGWLPAQMRFIDNSDHFEITANYKSGAPPK